MFLFTVTGGRTEGIRKEPASAGEKSDQWTGPVQTRQTDLQGLLQGSNSLPGQVWSAAQLLQQPTAVILQREISRIRPPAQREITVSGPALCSKATWQVVLEGTAILSTQSQPSVRLTSIFEGQLPKSNTVTLPNRPVSIPMSICQEMEVRCCLGRAGGRVEGGG